MKFLIILTVLALASTAFATDTFYRIDKGVRLLAFVGKPYGRVVEPVIYHTAIDQPIRLYHKKSGPGVYAFYLEGVIVRDEQGVVKKAPEGFFCVRKRLLKRQK